jgi:hypothetical protein
VKPWEEPNFGVTFRYRESPASSAPGSTRTSFCESDGSPTCYGSGSTIGSTLVSFPSPQGQVTKHVTVPPSSISPSVSTSPSARNAPSTLERTSKELDHSNAQNPKKPEPSSHPESTHHNNPPAATINPGGKLTRVGQRVQDLEAQLHQSTEHQDKDNILAKRDSEYRINNTKMPCPNVMDAFKSARTPLPAGAAPFVPEYVYSQDWDLPKTVIETNNPNNPKLQAYLRENKIDAILRPDLLALPPTRHDSAGQDAIDEFVLRPSCKIDSQFIDPALKQQKFERMAEQAQSKSRILFTVCENFTDAYSPTTTTEAQRSKQARDEQKRLWRQDH